MSAIVVASIMLGSGCGTGSEDEAPAPKSVSAAAPVATNAPSTPARPANAIRFTDVTTDSGLDATMTCGAERSSEILEVNGGGLALIDYDGDGDLDLFLANGATLEAPEKGPGSRLFRNDGNLRFADVTTAAGITLTRWAMGVAVGDADGDRRDDLYVTCFGPDVLLRNRGDGTFEDVTAQSGTGDPRWGTSGAFGDLDLDGDLDLYVVNYIEFDPQRRPPRAKYKNVDVMAGPHGLVAQHDTLYENLGGGTFRDVTAEAGCRTQKPAYGLNVSIADFDLDGRQDIFVANDSMANFLFRNVTPPPAERAPAETGAGAQGTVMRFEEIGMRSGIAANMDGSFQASMGIAIGDVDGNGFPDLFHTNFSSDTNTLHMNLDGLFYDDRTQQYGLGLVSRPFLGWACGFFDFDHDGDEDLLMFNGHVYPEATPESMDSEYLQVPLLFAREGNRFRRVSPDEAGAWLGERHRDRTAVFGDLDLDGDVDVIVAELNGPVRVLRNEAANGAADWLIVDLDDARPASGNHRGLGARVDLDIGGVRQRRWIFSGGGFQSSSAHEAHFGTGAGETGTVTVHWADGHEEQIEGVRFGERQIVRRAETEAH